MARPFAERPAALVPNRIDNGHRNCLFESLELAHDDRSVRPGTGKRNIKMIAAVLGFAGRGPVAFHPIAKGIVLTFERTVLGLLVGKLSHHFKYGGKPWPAIASGWK